MITCENTASSHSLIIYLFIHYFDHMCLLITAVVFGNTISPDTTDIGAVEGQKATLSCSYSSSGVTESLFWYRHYGRSKPEFLVATFSTTKESEVSGVDSRFSVKVTKKEQIHVILEILSAAVSDSALYYCALRPTFTGNTRTLYKNLSFFNPIRTKYIGCISQKLLWSQVPLLPIELNGTTDHS
uniref:Ig-like domain-containing protein n=1 Tax=Cyprinus carpio TaxID=7962 RepID=A0A8C2HRU2_CYPCA